MQNQKRLEALQQTLTSAWQKLELDVKITTFNQLEQEIADPNLWQNPKTAQEKTEQFARLKEQTEPWQDLKTQAQDLQELLNLNDPSLEPEIAAQIAKLEQILENLKQTLKFTGPYDHDDAILRITAGVGGTEAMDWAGMLERMYLRFFDRAQAAAENANNAKSIQESAIPEKSPKIRARLTPTLLERQSGEEAGIKTAVYEIKGSDAYGLLKSEHGVHRLVRLSPFNADNLRQTSFALVEILPVVKTTTLNLDEKDLRIDVYHSGGHGGQSVNTTNSAVRITHLPTNTVVAIQNERSQLQNKEKALEILKAKLTQMQIEQQAASLSDLRAGESAHWGQQIRNYVLQPYKLVKDTRTRYEETDADAVLDGKIDGFINAYLEL